ncbi:hypothetical protein [Accumulibacter sp.]|uniref:hypothetical protein n=1 Tax=Accumulibacter sp. TaxID=2053492 RepID=UPI001AC288AA|nr:hypothetical protein [Accumulibacter sp.]MBN8453249.1 hypothetical protein [Accumulibacter sp.]MBO3704988.1 hypothetical protein [Candidatus Accumulibacter conexus]
MTEHSLRTNEHEEAASALEALAEWAERVEKDIGYWRWVVLALHNTVQGSMVLALRGSDGLRPLRDDIAAKWLTAYRDGGQYPIEKLDSFLNRYKKVLSDTMLFFVHSKKVIPSRTLGRSVKKLNSLRNDFVHFLPRSWSLEVSGLPEICLDCLALVEFLAWECGNIIWHEEEHRERGKAAITLARNHFNSLERVYTTRAA